MLSENDKQYLLRNLNLNRVVLATGAGFSHDCTNSAGANLPASGTLASLLYTFLYDEPYDGASTLKTLYGAALRHRKGNHALRAFLRAHLHAVEIPEWYHLLPLWFWRRIYTFNADDVVEQIYERGGLQRIIAPDNFQERDQFLRKLQYIKLHGSLDSDKDLTFDPREYGSRAAARSDVWYQNFVEDYSTLPTVFVGTTLDEPLFWQYVEARGAQTIRGEKVRRPRCFLVSRSISRPSEDALDQFNVVSVRVAAGEFSKWLHKAQQPLTREAVLRLTNSYLEPAIQAAENGASIQIVARIEYFLTVFRISVRPTVPRPNPLFLMGAPATWDDIAADMDAPREVNEQLHDLLVRTFRNAESDIVQVGSPAGGGKSTVCRRAALNLVDDGFAVYFSDATTRPDASKLADHLLTLEQRCFLFFDNAASDIPLIADLWNLVKGAKFVPVFIVSSRTNDLAYYSHEFTRLGARIADFSLGDLTDSDCRSLVKTLDNYDLLGELKDKTDEERLAVFQKKARKQILVAMKEATSGRGFDEILRDEFRTLNTADAQLLYLIAALASDDDYGLSLQAMISAMELAPNETLLLVEQSLKGILVPRGERETYLIRHPAIASFIISSAPRDSLAEALTALLISLASVMPSGKEKRRTRAFRLYRKIVSHTLIQNLFVSRKLARQIYEGIKDRYRDDGHYWLQYASYEIEGGGDIALAENYLKQAEVLLYNSRQVETAMAHLLFRKAEFSDNASVANSYKEEALQILRTHMADSANVSVHALHIFGDKMATFVERWVPVIDRSTTYGIVLQELRSSITEQMKGHRLLEATLRNLQKLQLETLVRPR